MSDTASQIVIKNDAKPGYLTADGKFRKGNPGGGRKEKPETIVLRQIRKTAPQGILKAQQRLIELVDDDDKQISLAASKALWSKAPDIPWDDNADRKQAAQALPMIAALIQIQSLYNASGMPFELTNIVDIVRERLTSNTIEIESKSD